MYYKLLKLKNRVYDAAQIDWDHMMFDRSTIWKLLIPLMIENLLASFMGMADSMMVTRGADYHNGCRALRHHES